MSNSVERVHHLPISVQFFPFLKIQRPFIFFVAPTYRFYHNRPGARSAYSAVQTKPQVVADTSFTCAILGVTQDVSARRVAAAVARHVQQLGWATQRDLDLEEDWQLTQDHLQHTGINADGVINQIRQSLDHVGAAMILVIAFTNSRSSRRSCTVCPPCGALVRAR